MARKIDRYGRNRQFRRNPTRSPKFFPYQLPFQPDFRLLSNTGTEISAETAARWRQVVADIAKPRRKREYDSDSGDGYYGPYTPSQQADDIQQGLKRSRKFTKNYLINSLNGIPIGRGLVALDTALAAGIKKGFAQHARNNELQFYNYWI